MFFLQTNGSGVLSFAGVSASAGQIIQVVTATDNTARSTTSTSYVTGSNTLSVSITPSSASNKIFIIVSSSGQGGNDVAYFTIFKNGSNLTGAEGLTCHYDGGGGHWSPLCMTFLDSPATTSATTYQVYLKGTAGATATINRINPLGRITCMEIKG